MIPGDVIRLHTIRSVAFDGKSWVEYRPDEKKKNVFVVLLLGIEPKEIEKRTGERLNPIKTLESFGWKQKKPRKER